MNDNGYSLTSFPSGPVTTVQFLLHKKGFDGILSKIWFPPLELLEILLLGVKVVHSSNAIVVAIEGGENSWAVGENR